MYTISLRLQLSCRLLHVLVTLAILTALWAWPAVATDTTPGFTPSVLVDRWETLRSGLVEWGVTPTITYTTDLLGNPLGGQQQRFRYAGDLSGALAFDLQKLFDLRDVQFLLSGTWRSGHHLAQDIGSVFSPAQVYGGDTVRLYQLAFRQALFDNRVTILVGRIGLGDDFLTLPLYGTFVSGVVNSNPSSVPANLPGFSAQPVATWGGTVRVQLTEAFYVMAGVYNSKPGLGRNSAHGVDFGLGNGAISIAELGYLHNQGKGASGLPGTYKIGGYYDSSRFADLASSSGAEVRGNGGCSIHVEQMLYREEGAQGLTPFVVLTVAPSERRNLFPFFIAAGLVYQGLFPERDTDVTGFSLAYGRFSKELDTHSSELLLEWTHAFVLTPWLTVQPDVQYLIRPGGTGDIANVLVLGAQIALKF